MPKIDLDKLVLVNVAPNFDHLRTAIEFLLAAHSANIGKLATLDRQVSLSV